MYSQGFWINARRLFLFRPQPLMHFERLHSGLCFSFKKQTNKTFAYSALKAWKIHFPFYHLLLHGGGLLLLLLLLLPCWKHWRYFIPLYAIPISLLCRQMHDDPIRSGGGGGCDGADVILITSSAFKTLGALWQMWNHFSPLSTRFLKTFSLHSPCLPHITVPRYMWIHCNRTIGPAIYSIHTSAL